MSVAKLTLDLKKIICQFHCVTSADIYILTS